MRSPTSHRRRAHGPASVIVLCALIASPPGGKSGLHAQTTSAPQSTRPATGPASSTVVARRFLPDSFWVQTWHRGGADEDDIFIEPRAIAVVDGVVTILDRGTRELLALDATLGATLHVKESRGTGPGEFKRPSILIASGGHVGVLDQESARLSVFTPRGALVWDTPVPRAMDAESGCILSDARVVFKTSGYTRALLRVDSAGRNIARFSIPGSDPDNPPPSLAQEAFVAGPAAGDRCAIVPLFGATWYSISGAGTVREHQFIEPGQPAVVQTTSRVLERQKRDEIRQVSQRLGNAPITSGAMAIGDTVVVKAGATATGAYLLLDYYLLPTGRYLHSRRLPAAFTALTADSHGTFYGTQIGGEFSRVMAFRPSRTRPSAPAR